jgi:hypothetical protein
MIKQGEMVVYKNLGTYQLIIEDFRPQHDIERYYQVRHFSGLEVQADTIKEAKKCLEDFERVAQEIQGAINKLTRYGYRVFKDVTERG